MKKLLKKFKTIALIVSLVLVVAGIALLVLDFVTPAGKEYVYENEDTKTTIEFTFDEFTTRTGDISVTSDYELEDGEICVISELLGNKITTPTYEYGFATIKGVATETEYKSTGAIVVLIVGIVLIVGGACLGAYTCVSTGKKGKKRK